MRLNVLWVAALAVTLCACSRPAQTTSETSAPEATTAAAFTPTPEQTALIDAVTPVLAADLAQPVVLNVRTAAIDGDWGWVVATPRSPSGARLDFSRTKYAERDQAGALDSDGETYALLHRGNGVWRVREFVVGPSDVAYVEWPQKHGAPESLMTP